MGTTASKLTKLAATKEAIRIAIESKGVEVSASEPFSTYPDKISSISSSGGDVKNEETVTVVLTLNGSSSTTAINGALIQVIDLSKGTTVNYNWNGNNLVFVIPAGNSYVVKPWTINSYMPPIQSSATAIKNYNRTITLNYVTAPTGVYYCTETGFLKDSNSGAIGVYVGSSNMKRVVTNFKGYDNSDMFIVDGNYVYLDKGQLPSTSPGSNLDNGRSNTANMPQSESYFAGTYKTAYFMPYWVQQITLFNKSCYIPAYNEMELIKNNISVITSYLSRIGKSSGYGYLLSTGTTKYSPFICYLDDIFNDGSYRYYDVGEEDFLTEEYDSGTFNGLSFGTLPMVEY